MKSLFVFLTTLLLTPIACLAQEEKKSFDQKMDAVLGPVADVAEMIIFFAVKIGDQGLPLVLVLLAGTAIFLTIYFRFVNIRALGLAVKTVQG
ncbi:MAG: alanine glycine permease, partial [Verrucomicrobiota bacterium]